MSGKYGIIYRDGPAFFVRRMEDGVLGPEMLVPEILDYMLEEIPDALHIGLVDGEYKLYGTVPLDVNMDPPTVRAVLSKAEDDPQLMSGLVGMVIELQVTLGLTTPIPFGTN